MLRSFRIHGQGSKSIHIDETNENDAIRVSIWWSDNLRGEITLTRAAFEELCCTRDLVEYEPDPSKPKRSEED